MLLVLEESPMVEAVCGMLLYCWVSYMDPYLGSSGPIQAATTEQCDGGTKLSQCLKFNFINDFLSATFPSPYIRLSNL